MVLAYVSGCWFVFYYLDLSCFLLDDDDDDDDDDDGDGSRVESESLHLCLYPMRLMLKDSRDFH
jgi:hypothetical protein